jgi:hypothetical protein
MRTSARALSRAGGDMELERGGHLLILYAGNTLIIKTLL